MPSFRTWSVGKLLVIGVVLGLLTTAGSGLVTSEFHPTPDGYGDARVFGYPWPFAYTLTSERNASYMTWQVGCSLVFSCEDASGPSRGNPLVGLPLLVDWSFWSVAWLLVFALGRLSLPRLFPLKR
jgi:hypothetical protein